MASMSPLKDDKENYDKNWLKGTSAENLLNTKPKITNVKNDFSDPIYKKISRINGKINSMSMNELVNSLKELNLETKGKKEVLVRRLKNYHKVTNLETNKNNPNFEKSFDYVCVIDFEATCCESISKINSYPHEIIEFPIVLINTATLEIADRFQTYCKPIINPKLTSFCTSLTGITQEQVDNAHEFTYVLNQVNDWLNKHELGSKYKFAVATDGPWDMQKFLYQQCLMSKIPFPNWAKKWIDIRKLFSNWFGLRRCNINKMLDYIGLKFEGNPHCGLDDSVNIARIFIKIVGDGCKIKTNDRIKTSLAEEGEEEEVEGEKEEEINPAQKNESNSD